MPRPSIDHLFDSQIRIWRPAATTDDLAIEHRTYTPLATVGAAINRSKTAVTQVPGGMNTVGSLRWYGRPTIDVHKRDVCEIVGGPDAGTKWEVDAEPVRPRGHHTQVDCVEWHGDLSEGDDVS